MRMQGKIFLSFAIALATTSAASAQRRAVPATPDEVGLVISLQVAGQPYNFEGKAACQHPPKAAIYGVPADMWRVEQIDSQRAIMLTLWHPRSLSGDMFSLSVQTGNKGHIVNTVNSGRRSSVVGSGKVSFTPSGAGGAFTINAKTPDGAAITGTIKCSAFTDVTAEGG